jgi:hypothetical protein
VTAGSKAPRLASVSVDLDSLHHYCRIHGVPETLLSDEARALVYALAVPRFLQLFREADVNATFFVVGEDAEAAWAQGPLKDAAAQGMELGNHSHGHAYHLTRLPTERLAEQVKKGGDAIEAVCGRRPTGFRAPGYTLSASLLQELERQGYLYDSSAFPAAPYYLAKAGVMALLSLTGRPSRAVLDTPRVLFAPRVPYRPSSETPYRRGASPVLELPMSVTPWARFPFIGASVTLLPRAVWRQAYRSLQADAFFNFELHGVDLLDAEDGIPQALVRRQRDLAVPWAVKRARLAEVLSWLKQDAEVVTLEQAARALRA